MARKLVIGNWKLNGSFAFNQALLNDLARRWPVHPNLDMVVCPPFPFLAQAFTQLAGSAVLLGSQDVSDHSSGAYTGEVSAGMLAEFGVRYAIVGHSERRARFHESDGLIAGKAAAALAAGIVPIVCIGETLVEHDAGHTLAVLQRQLSAVMERLPSTLLSRVALAYEPLWAIGSGKSAEPATVQKVHSFLRGVLAQVDLASAADVPILYGGSVKASNAAEYAAQRDVDGVLVGGASLKAQEFLDIGAGFLPR